MGVFSKNDREHYFSGYRSSTVEVPKKLRARPTLIEAWSWIGSGIGFKAVGVTSPGGRYTEKSLGESGVLRGKAHILFGPGECEEVRIIRGMNMVGRWKMRFADALSVEPLPPKATGKTSRVFQCPAPGTRLSARFGDVGGRLGVYDERGERVRVLAERGHRFDEMVTIPDVTGLLAVEGTLLQRDWGPMTEWTLRTEE
ncbi:hypothetical protein ACLMNJ_15215 [Streptomyces seoulensis]